MRELQTVSAIENLRCLNRSSSPNIRDCGCGAAQFLYQQSNKCDEGAGRMTARRDNSEFYVWLVTGAEVELWYFSN